MSRAPSPIGPRGRPIWRRCAGFTSAIRTPMLRQQFLAPKMLSRAPTWRGSRSGRAVQLESPSRTPDFAILKVVLKPVRGPAESRFFSPMLAPGSHLGHFHRPADEDARSPVPTSKTGNRQFAGILRWELGWEQGLLPTRTPQQILGSCSPQFPPYPTVGPFSPTGWASAAERAEPSQAPVFAGISSAQSRFFPENPGDGLGHIPRPVTRSAA
mgnify:FL=1